MKLELTCRPPLHQHIPISISGTEILLSQDYTLQVILIREFFSNVILIIILTQIFFKKFVLKTSYPIISNYSDTRPQTFYTGKALTEVEELGYEQHPKGSIEKSTFYAHRLRQGELPVCVETCPSGARLFGDLDDPLSQVSQLVKGGVAKAWLEQQGTHLSVFYIEPEN
jgi:hypothetical protein